MIEHGTTKGWHQHVSRGHRGVQICTACREARNTYQRDYMRAHYTPEKRRRAYRRRLERYGHP
jgi:hypothetical protein